MDLLSLPPLWGWKTAEWLIRVSWSKLLSRGISLVGATVVSSLPDSVYSLSICGLQKGGACCVLVLECPSQATCENLEPQLQAMEKWWRLSSQGERLLDQWVCVLRGSVGTQPPLLSLTMR